MLKWLIAIGEIVITFMLIIKDIIKNTNKQPNEETHRMISSRSRAEEFLSAWSWDAPPCGHHPRKSPNLCSGDFIVLDL